MTTTSITSEPPATTDTSAEPRRIGILLTSDDTSEFAARFPDDGEKFKTLLRPLAPADWHFEVLPAMAGVLPENCRDFDGYVITGSPASVRDRRKKWIAQLLDFIRVLDSERVPTVGVCFGHQAIAMALGGHVERNPTGWQLGVAFTEFSTTTPWMVPPSTELALYAAHNEQVVELPGRAVRLGSAEGCENASFQVDQHFATTEYHPEMPLEFMQALADHLEPHLGAHLCRRARQELKLATAGATFGRWMIRFLGATHPIPTPTPTLSTTP